MTEVRHYVLGLVASPFQLSRRVYSMVNGQSESLPGGAGCSSYRHGGLDRSRRGLGVHLRYGASVVCAVKKEFGLYLL